MSVGIDHWVQKLWPRELPVLARTADELAKLAPRAETLPARKIADAILPDPMMTLNVLQLANSRQSSRFGTEITTVEHAVMMLGIAPFFNHFNKLERVEELYRNQERALHAILRLVSRAYHAACYAWDLAALRKDVKAEEVYIAALLADLGELLLWLAAPETALEIEKRAQTGDVASEAARQEVLGCGLPELAQALGPAWRIPELLLALMNRDNTGNPRAMTANLSLMLAHHSDPGWHGAALLADYEAVAAFMHMTLDEVVAEIHRTAVFTARHWEWFHVRPAAAWLPMLPGEWPSEETPAAFEGAEEIQVEACLMPQHDKYERAMQEVADHLDGSLNLHDMMSLVLKGMYEGIGLNRVVFALLSADRAKLKAKYVVGAESGSPLRTLEVDMDGKHLLARLMEKTQGVWYREANKAALDPLIPDEVRRQIGEGEFFAISVFVHDKPVGLFYADRKHGSCSLDEHAYNEFKRLAMRAAEGLAHVAKK